MNEQRTSPGVLLYYTLFPDVFAKLNAEQGMLLLQAIFSTGGVCPMPELDAVTDMAWGMIRTMLEINDERYQQTRQMNSAAGKKGAQKRAENLEAQRQKVIDEASAESLSFDEQAPPNEQALSFDDLTTPNEQALSFDQQAEANEQALSFDQQANNNNSNSNSNNDSNNMITNAHSADADEGSLSAACSADAEPERKKSSSKKQSVSKKIEEHFRELWLLYPLKRGKNHVSAAAKRRLAEVSEAEMARAIDLYEREYENAPPDRQMLYGSTWFNGRWEDYSDDNYTPAPAKPAQKSARAQQAQFRSAEEESKQADYWASREE